MNEYAENSPCEERFFHQYLGVMSVHHISVRAELHCSVHSMLLGVMQ